MLRTSKKKKGWQYTTTSQSICVFLLLDFPVICRLGTFITSVLYANLLTFFLLTVSEGIEADGIGNRWRW